jgi:hypothetical protein
MTTRIPCFGRQWEIWSAKSTTKRDWMFTSACAAANPLFFTPWNKDRTKEGPREWRESLFGGLDRLRWIESHRDWFYVGQWNYRRKARPIWLTPKGRAALKKSQAIEAAGGIG